ncbi:protein RER1A-like isoform X3 [Nicotiana tomentosiformis]|nr:protein RER1A-like isoform X2 [Nicotiana tomentosiformis]XP_009614090.1 protein RER1A-like isoform X2 [Nicotiana tomentosiformis]
MEVVGDNGASAATASDQRTLKSAELFQHYLDKTTPHALYRWTGTAVLALLYALRIYSVQGFYFVTYCLGFYIVNLLVGFLSPLVDPKMEPSDGPVLPTKASDEFKPFISRLPEFKFWYAIIKALCIAFIITFFSLFDVPTYWPFLLFLWILHFVGTMDSLIRQMIRYKYIPFNLGKQKLLWKKARTATPRT